MSVTFSTCWYKLKSKFDVDVYKKWISNFICNVNNFNLVIYTDSNSFDTFKEMINDKNKKIKVILKDFRDFKGYENSKRWINNHLKNNLLRERVDWKLNMLWSEKINFVKESMQYFKTEYYGWCDIGYFRDDFKLDNWPNLNVISNLNNDKIYYAQVSSDKTIMEGIKFVTNLNDKGMPKNEIPNNQVTIAGGFFITNKKNIEWWYNTYYKRIDDYFDNEYLIKDDQTIILDCFCNNINKFQLIYNGGDWFVFKHFLK